MLAFRLEHDLVHIAPGPIFAGLNGSDDGMLRSVEMFGCVLIGRAIAAADVAAGQAHAKMHPGAAHLETFLAPFRVGPDVVDLIEMRTGLQIVSPNGVTSPPVQAIVLGNASRPV